MVRIEYSSMHFLKKQLISKIEIYTTGDVVSDSAKDPIILMRIILSSQL